MEKSQPLSQQASPSQGKFSSEGDTAPSKIARILEHLLFTGSLNRFEAERIGDHCLHSTISSLANNYGLSFKRTSERVPNHWGQPCDVTRYSLLESQHQRALEVLELLRKPAKQRREVAA